MIKQLMADNYFLDRFDWFLCGFRFVEAWEIFLAKLTHMKYLMKFNSVISPENNYSNYTIIGLLMSWGDLDQLLQDYLDNADSRAH